MKGIVEDVRSTKPLELSRGLLDVHHESVAFLDVRAERELEIVEVVPIRRLPRVQLAGFRFQLETFRAKGIEFGVERRGFRERLRLLALRARQLRGEVRGAVSPVAGRGPVRRRRLAFELGETLPVGVALRLRLPRASIEFLPQLCGALETHGMVRAGLIGRHVEDTGERGETRVEARGVVARDARDGGGKHDERLRHAGRRDGGLVRGIEVVAARERGKDHEGLVHRGGCARANFRSGTSAQILGRGSVLGRAQQVEHRLARLASKQEVRAGVAAADLGRGRRRDRRAHPRGLLEARVRPRVEV